MPSARVDRPQFGLLSFVLALAELPFLTGTSMAQDPLDRLSKPGPFTANLGTVAQIKVPAGYRFIDKANIKAFNDLTQNLTSPREVGAILPQNNSKWHIIFSYNDEGYVKDDEKGNLDADAILNAMKEMDGPANEERTRLGMPSLHTVGWEKPPFFDDRTKNLTWGLRVQCAGQVSINYNARILGRGGYMSAMLVCNPSELALLIPTFDTLLNDFSYVQGQKYSEWRPGDKVAAVGLTGLVLGGGVAVAAKSGWLGKFLKPLIVGAVALFSAIGAFFKKLFGRSGSNSEESDGTNTDPSATA